MITLARSATEDASWMNNRALLFSALLVLYLSVPQAQSQFQPPRIMQITQADPNLVAEGVPDRIYYMGRGVDTNIKVGQTLNVYREKEISLGPGVSKPLRVYLGTMSITASQEGISVGHF